MKYRVYATILGYTLPTKPTELSFRPGRFQRETITTIAKMTFKEQKKRSFKPIRTSYPNTAGYRRFLTNNFGSDYKILRSNHVMHTDIVTHGIGAAVGLAIQIFDKIIGNLVLNASVLFANKYKRSILHQTYDYQIVKVYNIDDSGDEKENEEELLTGGWVSMPNWPQRNIDFSELDTVFLNATLNSTDEVFNRSFRYLTEGDKSFHANEPIQEAFLNWVKSIELIVNEFRGNTFRKRLNLTAKKIGLMKEEVDRILQAWDVRSNGDFAHARKSSRDFYAAQYPPPKDQDFIPYGINDLSILVLIKYFELIDGIIEVRVHKNHPYKDCEYLNQIIEVNVGEYYQFHTHTHGQTNIIKKIKKSLQEHFGISTGKIKPINKANSGLINLKNQNYYFKIKKLSYSINRENNS